ncbi:MAG: VOC family protein [Deltaproteobacteria bacterium]|nr:VOC family protein [Deltaproteobacteria bacterium]
MKKTSTFIWNELISPDQNASGEFYCKLFGWEKKQVNAGPFGTYTTFQKGDQEIAGMMNPTIDYTKKLGSRWYGYVAVEDIDASVAKAKELGATIVAGPDDIPGVGKVCLFADPVGALIRIMQPVRKD